MEGKGTNGNGKGAPSLSQEQSEDLFKALEDGTPIRPALMSIGLTRSKADALKKQAERVKKGALREWWDAIECARAKGEVKHWRCVAAGGKESRGSLRVLEYSYGYTRTERQEIEAKTETTGKVEYVLRRVPPREEKPEKEKPKEGPDDGE